MKRIFFGLIGLCIAISLKAQDDVDKLLPQIIPPSPEVAAFQKYGNLPVSTYTGVPNISIPIYQVQQGDISVPITLSYNASGIRVNEEATWVGLGWSLSAGGMISHQIMGKNDLAIDGEYFYETIFTSNDPPDVDVANMGAVYWGTCMYNNIDLEEFLGYGRTVDFEPDIYSFNLPGKSGKFMLDRDKIAILAKREKIDIQISDAQGESFTITDEKGMVYSFDVIETTFNRETPSLIKMAWYLSEIRSPKGHVVTFHYKPLSHSESGLTSIFEQKTIYNASTDAVSLGCPQIPPVTKISPVSYQSYELSYIDYDLGQVHFETADDRIDYKGGRRLRSIKVYEKDASGDLIETPIKEFNFIHDYFSGTFDDDIYQPNGLSTQDDLLSKRLKLVSLIETANGEMKPPYQFDYYDEGTNNILPSKSSFARDHWGYYNGALSNTSLIPSYKGLIAYPTLLSRYLEVDGANRDPNEVYMQAFSLKEIKYPLGGRTEFMYEPNTFDVDSSMVNDYSLSSRNEELDLRETQSPLYFYSTDNEVQEETVDISDMYAPSNPTLKITFRCNDCQNVTEEVGKVYVEFDGTRYDFNQAIEGVECDRSQSVCPRSLVIDKDPGIYSLKMYSEDPAIVDIFVQLDYTSEISNSSDPIAIGGGLRIAEIRDYPGNSSTGINVRKFKYHYKEDRDGDGVEEEYSYGRRMAKPKYAGYGFDFHSGSPGVLPYNFNWTCFKLVMTGSSSIALNGAAQGSVVGYDQVTVLNGENGEYGKTVFYYENNPDHIFDYQYFRVPGLPNLSSSRNGLLKKQEEYAYVGDSYVKVSETENNYNAENVFINTQNQKSYIGIRKFDHAYSNGGVYTNCSIDLFSYVAFRSDWIKLKSTEQRIYDQNDTGSELETITSYFYDNPEHYQMTRQTVTNSKDQTVETQIKYPLDYTMPGPSITKLNEKHIVNVPIEQIKLIDGKVVSGTATKYEYNSNDDQILPKSIYLIETIEGLSSLASSSDGENFDPNFVSRVQFLKYDSRGNVLSYSKENDMVTSIIWGYDKNLPVAKLENVTIDELEDFFGGADFTLEGENGKNLSNQQIDDLKIAFPNAFISTYSFDPLVGLVAMTDPNGKTTTYEYDDLNRLKLIRDFEGNILKRATYHYKEEY